MKYRTAVAIFATFELLLPSQAVSSTIEMSVSGVVTGVSRGIVQRPPFNFVIPTEDVAGPGNVEETDSVEFRFQFDPNSLNEPAISSVTIGSSKWNFNGQFQLSAENDQNHFDGDSSGRIDRFGVRGGLLAGNNYSVASVGTEHSLTPNLGYRLDMSLSEFDNGSSRPELLVTGEFPLAISDLSISEKAVGQGNITAIARNPERDFQAYGAFPYVYEGYSIDFSLDPTSLTFSEVRQPDPAATIYLDFDNGAGISVEDIDIPFIGQSVSLVNPFGTTASSNLSQGVRDSIEVELEDIFLRSGVKIHVTQDVEELDGEHYVVEFAESSALLGYAYDVGKHVPWSADQFDRRKNGTVAVFGEAFGEDPADFSTALLIESAAHELGHAFGARHVEPNSNSVMDSIQGDVRTVAFSDEVSPIDDFLSIGDHNPQYHIRRFLGGEEAPISLESGEILDAGSWDTPFLNFVSEVELISLSSVEIESWYLFSSGSDLAHGGHPYVVEIGAGVEQPSISITMTDNISFGILARTVGSADIDLFLGESGDLSFGREYTREDILSRPIELFRFDGLSNTINSIGEVSANATRTFVVGPTTVPLPASILLLGFGLGLIFTKKIRRDRL